MPENITASVNKAVHQSFSLHLMNGTEGEVASTGGCVATNPIDKCWRCNSNWEKNRQRLADCGIGFGRNAKGGKAGEIYVVTDDSDDAVNPRPGTLRYGVTRKRPLWIIFARDMQIGLQQELIMKSDKTIDARGAKVLITGGCGFTLQYIKNVIIHGINIFNIVPGSGGMIRDSEDHVGLRTKSDGDGISIFGSQDIWIDHVTMSRSKDGLIDVIEGSTGVSITNGYFTEHNEVMLFGAHDNSAIDKKMQVTVAFNHFGEKLIQRIPRCRFGYVHVVNNDYTQWFFYAIGGSSHPTIISQGNKFVALNDNTKKEVTRREAVEGIWKSWDWISDNNYFVNGAIFVPSGDPNWAKKHSEFNDGLKATSGGNVPLLTKFSGVILCIVGKPC